MPVNPKSKARMDEFLDELEKHDIKAIHSVRSVYRVNDKNVSIRTTTKPAPKFWYDISEGIMNGVDYFIYQTDSPQHFALISSHFFKECYSKLQDSNRPNAKIFYIDWQHKMLESGQASLDIAMLCCSLHPGENAGNWAEIFLDHSITLDEQVDADLNSLALEEQLEEGGKTSRLVAFYEGNTELRTKCQRAVKSSQVGGMKSSHFEQGVIRGRVSSTPYWLMETLHGESTQYGEDSGDRTATSLKVVPAEDRSGAWN